MIITVHFTDISVTDKPCKCAITAPHTKFTLQMNIANEKITYNLKNAGEWYKISESDYLGIKGQLDYCNQPTLADKHK